MNEHLPLPEVQVAKKHYFERDYDHLSRFIGYHFEIRAVLDLKPQTVLEVGMGNGLVADYLKQRGIAVQTIDIDAALAPDYLGSVTAMPIPDASFDVVLASLVLEHLPFNDVGRALREIARVSRRFAVIAVPDARPSFIVACKIPFLRWFQFIAKLPVARTHQFDGQHHWVLGARGCSVRAFEDLIRGAGFCIRRSFVPAESNATHFFILEKIG